MLFDIIITIVIIDIIIVNAIETISVAKNIYKGTINIYDSYQRSESIISPDSSAAPSLSSRVMLNCYAKSGTIIGISGVR